jgi:hypothetical protein
MMAIFKKDPYASFGFIGSLSAEESEKRGSKRYRVYKQAIANLISPVSFIHYEKVEYNSYLMLNRHSEELLPDIEQMFIKYYPSFG